MQRQNKIATSPLGPGTLFYWSIAQNLDKPAQLLLADHVGSLPRRFSHEAGIRVISVNTRCGCVHNEEIACDILISDTSIGVEQVNHFEFLLGRQEEVIVYQNNILAGFSHETLPPPAQKVVTIDSHFMALRDLAWVHIHDPDHLEDILIGGATVFTQQAPLITFELADQGPAVRDALIMSNNLLQQQGYLLYDNYFTSVSLNNDSCEESGSIYLAIRSHRDNQDFVDSCRSSVAPYMGLST